MKKEADLKKELLQKEKNNYMEKITNPQNTIEKNEQLIIKKDFFAFQIDFAKELYNKTKEVNPNSDFLTILKHVAPMVRAEVFEYDENKKDFVDDLKLGVTEENLLDKAYEAYLIEFTKDKNPVEDTKDEANQKFGPIWYLTAENENTQEETRKNNISFHFSNDDNLSSRQLLNINERKINIASLLKDIKSKHPDVKTLSTASWLLDAIPDSISQKLFPQSFIDSMCVKESKVGWSLGTMIWGQFLDAQGNLKKQLAEELMKNLKNMKDGEYLIDLLQPPLHKPKSAIADIQDFYSMYNV